MFVMVLGAVRAVPAVLAVHPWQFLCGALIIGCCAVSQVMAVLDAMPSSNLRPEDDSEVEANRVYRTTYMFSATMPPSVERLARKCGFLPCVFCR